MCQIHFLHLQNLLYSLKFRSFPSLKSVGQSHHLNPFQLISCQTFSAIWLALTRDDAACPIAVTEHSSACAACKLVCPRLPAWSRTPSAWELEFTSPSSRRCSP